MTDIFSPKPVLAPSSLGPQSRPQGAFASPQAMRSSDQYLLDYINSKDLKSHLSASKHPQSTTITPRGFGPFEPQQFMLTAEAQRWKEFNSYAPRDHNTRTKERIRSEFNSDIWELALKREAEIRARKRQEAQGSEGGIVTPATGGFDEGFSWKLREVEQVTRNFKENARFFVTTKNRRDHGLKFVPKPVTDTVTELIEEQKATEIKNPNYLNNPRYTQILTGGENSQLRHDKEQRQYDIGARRGVSNKYDKMRTSTQIEVRDDDNKSRDLVLFSPVQYKPQHQRFNSTVFRKQGNTPGISQH